MDDPILEESLKLIDPIAKDFFNFLKPPTVPSAISPFSYLGIGSFPIEEKPFEADIFQLVPTLPTMTIEPKRDLITGEIISYENLSISTLPPDCSDPNRQIGSIEQYHRGSKINVPFYPGTKNIVPKSANVDFKPLIESLDTGMNLLVTPFSDEVENAEKDEELPSLPISIGEATPVPNPRAEDEYNEDHAMTPSIQYKAIKDTFDISELEKYVPNMACKFKYKLDEFQARSIYRLERNESVFVSAPTSAGKTVVAQYAIALCRSHKMRALYTSPIKALSNQKFRDFTIQFGDVGILTGDVSINREASVLIMTTEILRSMLYRGADILRDVECVIFDECHYISDEERGVVWEESIILMPPHINMVFLSATMPNSEEIASWIARTKERPVYVEVHNERPVPLSHSIYYFNKIYKIVDPTKKENDRSLFDDNQYKNARSKVRPPKGKYNKPFNPMFQQSYWPELVSNLKKHDLLPALMFSFSIKKCEEYARFSIKGTNLLTNEERNYVTNFFHKTVRRLPEHDRNLPQIKVMLELLKCGIGVHHSGILPILRETVEILLSDGYLKVLFCTSTFAMGINVPVRTCVFTNLTKFNGKTFVNLTQTEYLQMSGRAGRRGLDKVGTTVLCVGSDFPERDYLYELFCGQAENLQSQFHIRFNMILNSIRVQGMRMVDLLKRSLSANSIQKQVPIFKKRIEGYKKNISQLEKITNCPYANNNNNPSDDIEDIECGTPIRELVNNTNEIIEINSKIVAENISMFVNSIKEGMLVLFTNNKHCKIALVDEFRLLKDISINDGNLNDQSFIISLFFATGGNLQVRKIDDLKHLHLLTAPITTNTRFLDSDTRKLKINNFKPDENLKQYKEFIKNKNASFVELSDKHHQLILEILNSQCFKCSSLSSHYEISTSAHNLRKLIKENTDKFKDEQIELIPLLQCYFNMLRNMGYITGENEKIVLNPKGHVAIELNNAHEIISTELLYSGFFDDCTPEETAALASCLIAQRQGKNNECEDYPPNLVDKIDKMTEIGQYVQDQMIENAVPFDEEEFLSYNINPAATTPVYLWATGQPFEEIMRHAQTILEGGIVRIIIMDHDLLKNFSNAAKVMGLKSLSEKFETAAEIIKRDIIFTGSLYLD